MPTLDCEHSVSRLKFYDRLVKEKHIHVQIHKGVFSNHGDVLHTITKNISFVAILNFIQIRHNNVPVWFFSIWIINPENISVDTRIVILFELQLETQDINAHFWNLGW